MAGEAVVAGLESPSGDVVPTVDVTGRVDDVTTVDSMGSVVEIVVFDVPGVAFSIASCTEAVDGVLIADFELLLVDDMPPLMVAICSTTKVSQSESPT